MDSAPMSIIYIVLLFIRFQGFNTLASLTR